MKAKEYVTRNLLGALATGIIGFVFPILWILSGICLIASVVMGLLPAEMEL